MKYVLDHGYVRLVDRMGTDLSAVRAARVSYDGDDKTGNDPIADAKLLRYMIMNNHTSPFESVVFTFEVKAPIFVYRQWHRHRTWSYNELSARYAKLDEGFYVPSPEVIGVQSAKDKQARDIDALMGPKHIAQSQIIRGQSEQAIRIYMQLLEGGVPRELARSVLPVNVYSRMYATVDLHNLMHFLFLRTNMHAQWEIRQYAKAIWEIVQPFVPTTMGAFRAKLDKWAKDNNSAFDLP